MNEITEETKGIVGAVGRRGARTARAFPLAGAGLAAILAAGACTPAAREDGGPSDVGGPIGQATSAILTGSACVYGQVCQSAEALATLQRGRVGNVFDSGIDDNGVSSNHASGTSGTIPIGESGTPTETPRQEVMNFDLTPITSLGGAGYTDVGAQLSLYLCPTTSGQTINVHQATQSWGATPAQLSTYETTVSWPSFDESFTVTPSDPSFSAGATNAFPGCVQTGMPNNARVDVSSLVSGWLNGAAQDGILMEQPPVEGVSTVVLTSEYPHSGYRPTLSVQFSVTCATGTADCNDSGSDGCETSIGTDPNNCGACGNVCAAGATCQAGACTTNLCANGVPHAAAELCLAPLAPLASLAAGACKSTLTPHNPTTCGPIGTFPAGIQPGWLAFDGTDMWFTLGGLGVNTVGKMSPTGAILGTYGVGSDPSGIAFDGTNMWVTNYSDNTVTVLSPTGATLGTYRVRNAPSAIAFDGTNMWVTNYVSTNGPNGNNGDGNTVQELSPTGEILGTFSAGNGPNGIAFDGTNMWVVNQQGASVTKLSPTGVSLGTFTVPSDGPQQIAFDGTNMWVTLPQSNSVAELSPSGVVLGNFPVGSEPLGIAFDGTNMWVTNNGGSLGNNGDDTVTALSPAGATLGTFAVGNQPGGIAFDGANMWIANNGSGSITEL